jgi:hypothetical protein
VHVQRHLCLAADEVADRHRDAASARHDERLEVGGRDETGIGGERQVDDRVVVERVEERGVGFDAALGGAGGEVPVRTGTARARADGEIDLPDDLVLDHRSTTEHLDHDSRADDQARLVGPLDRLEHARHGDPQLSASRNRHAPRRRLLLAARHDRDEGARLGVAHVRNEDRLVGAAAGRAGALGAVPRRRDGVRLGDGRNGGGDRAHRPRRRRGVGPADPQRGRHRDAATDDREDGKPSPLPSGRSSG